MGLTYVPNTSGPNESSGGGGGTASEVVIKDPSGNQITSTNNGGKQSLDVNVTDITISHQNDSVRLGDGTNLTQVTAAGELKVSTSGNVTSTPSGLKNGGRITEMTITDSAWWPIPATPLANRNAISVQNRSGHEIKFNYTNSVGYVGMVVADGYERHYDITDAVIIYARAIAGAGTITITVEEIS